MSFGKGNVEEVVYKPGDFILREGAMCDCLIVVKTGQIEVFKYDRDRKKIPLAVVNSGEYLGEMSLIMDKPHSANAVALVETVCLRISNDAIDEQLKSVPTWLLALTRGLVMKLYKTNEVLKRNQLVDETLFSSVKAIESKAAAEKNEDDEKAS